MVRSDDRREDLMYARRGFNDRVNYSSGYYYDQTGTNPYTVKPTLGSIAMFIIQGTAVLTCSAVLSKLILNKIGG